MKTASAKQRFQIYHGYWVGNIYFCYLTGRHHRLKNIFKEPKKDTRCHINSQNLRTVQLSQLQNQDMVPLNKSLHKFATCTHNNFKKWSNLSEEEKIGLIKNTEISLKKSFFYLTQSSAPMQVILGKHFPSNPGAIFIKHNGFSTHPKEDFKKNTQSMLIILEWLSAVSIFSAMFHLYCANNSIKNCISSPFMMNPIRANRLAINIFFDLLTEFAKKNNNT
ncbi:MAG TPA: hypothetical protein VKP03_01300 [Patescibacteria group bacterium]|nr:hypothetical protein [Patescibacteria group bacterium]